MLSFFMFGAGNETRTRDLYLGKVSLYQLSYSREEGSILAIFRGLSILICANYLARMRGHAALR